MTLRIGIVGYGNIGQQHAQTILSGAVDHLKLSAVCSSRDPKLEGVAWFASLTELISAGCVDALVIATPTHAHADQAQQALAAGLHVVVEKPIAPSVLQAKRVLNAVPEGVQLAVMLNQRFHPAYRKIKETLDSGVLGRLQRFSWIMTAWYRPNIYYEVSAWRGTWAGEGGGLLLNQCIHNLDVLYWWFGLPESVTSQAHFGERHTGAIEVDDEVTAMFAYANQMSGVLVASSGEAPGSNQLDIVGEQGTLRFDGQSLQLITLQPSAAQHISTTNEMFGTPAQQVQALELEDDVNQHAEVLNGFVDSIQAGKPGPTSADAGLGSLQLANSILQSAWVGERIDLPHDEQAYEAALHKRTQRGLRTPKALEVEIDMSKSYR